MEKPRIRHIAINVQDPGKTAEYYKKTFGLEERLRAPNGTIYLSDGFVDLALISTPRLPWGINHFGFQVESVEAVVKVAQTTAEANVFGAIAESWIRDPEGNRVDVSEHGWPV
jgi:catechol 2,3-dioxygenase-like lactoylglutathione lyase family enzyme